MQLLNHIYKNMNYVIAQKSMLVLKGLMQSLKCQFRLEWLTALLLSRGGNTLTASIA